jgi:hypothetical protein
MLTAAAHACRPGGFVIASLASDGARPTAEADRQAAIALGRRLGLALVEHSPLGIAYETPFFELNALRALGIVTPPHWRRGDLVVFRKVRALTALGPMSCQRTRLWREVVIGRMRLFIRAGGGALSGEARLRPIVAGDILPTVSRRDPRRRYADAWTSGNRIFRTGNPQLLLEAAISCASGATGSGVRAPNEGNLSECEEVKRVAASLRHLATIEASEELGAGLAIERSANWTLTSQMFWSGSTATPSG